MPLASLQELFVRLYSKAKEHPVNAVLTFIAYHIGLNTERALLSLTKPVKLDYNKGEANLRITYGRLKRLFGNNPLPLKIVLGAISLSRVAYHEGYQIMVPNWHGIAVFNDRRIVTLWPDKGELRLRSGFGEGVPEGVGLIGVLGVYPVV